MSRLKFSAPIIEIRGTSNLEKSPEYIVKAAITANIPDHYGTIKFKDGSKKALHSIFTENAINSMKRQAKSKKIYVDAEHKTAVYFRLKEYIDQLQISREDKEKMLKELELPDLPLAKVHDVYPDPENSNRMIWDTRLNPSFREVDEKHQKYFDAIWDSIQNKFIDSLSPDMVITDVKKEGDIDYINDVVLFGINYTGGGALPENNIFEVAMRATQTFNEEREGVRMQEDLERKQKELDDKERKLREREESIIKAEEAKKLEEIEKEKKLQKENIEKIQKELEELKRQKETGSRGAVPPEDKYGANQTPPEDVLAYKENVKKSLKENVRIKNPYPNRENLFRGTPRAVNPEGEMGFGQLRELQIDYIDSIKKNMSPDARGVLNDPNADIRIPKRLG